MDFSNWTRADFIAFDRQRELVFQPTPEEIEEQKRLQKETITSQVKNILTNYGIVFTGNETDFSELYREYIEGEPDMRQYLGEDLEPKVFYYSENENTFEQFCNFVLQYR